MKGGGVERAPARAQEREIFLSGGHKSQRGWDIKRWEGGGMGGWWSLASNRPICAVGNHDEIDNRKEGGATPGFCLLRFEFEN